jgi:CRISPR-associated protein Cas6
MTALPPSALVDVAFALQGAALPRDHAEGLAKALRVRLPWLESDGYAGIHPIKLVHGLEESALLSPRSRLLLRVPVHRVQELKAMSDCELSVQGSELRLGASQVRELLPHATLYAYKVAADSADEVSFMAMMARELAQLEITGEAVCGKHQSLMVSGVVLDAFSLMLHGLHPDQSLRLQQHGLGPHRLLGCGVFVPHKSAAAV